MSHFHVHARLVIRRGNVVDARQRFMVICRIATKGTAPWPRIRSQSGVTRLSAACEERRAFRSGRRPSSLLFVCALGLVWEFRRPWFQGNLGIVDPGRVIRSAQPTSQLPHGCADFHLKSILNLRGGSPADWWYEAEVRTAQESGLSFYDLH